MTNEEMRQSYLRQARRILAEAEHYWRTGESHLVVRRCQECVELALKATLRAAGIEVPHVHDVGVFLREHSDKFPAHLGPHLDRLVSISRRLREERELSFYGDEETGSTAENLYTTADADAALADARFVLDVCAPK